MRNLLENPFGGVVFPINPKRRAVQGVLCYPNLAAVPDKVELAVIATPAATVPNLVRECVERGVAAAIIISAGFAELGAVGRKLEDEIRGLARGKMRIVGPNCLGIIHPPSNLNASFAASMAAPGQVALLSQSGAICTAILDWARQAHVGFSSFVSVGSMLDVDFADLIDHFADDPATRSIVLYMESIGDVRKFLSAARSASRTKPVIVVKAGRHEAGARAAASHTGALAGADAVFDAAFRRAGVLRVETVPDLFHMSEILAMQPPPRGADLAIITNAGGPGVMATDALMLAGGQLAPLSSETLRQLNAALPPFWSHANPIDLLGDATPERYRLRRRSLRPGRQCTRSPDPADAAGHDRSHRDGPSAPAVRSSTEQAGTGLLDGRHGRARRYRATQYGRHSDLRRAGIGHPRLLAHGTVSPQPRTALRNAGGTAGGGRTRHPARATHLQSRSAPPAVPCSPK